MCTATHLYAPSLRAWNPQTDLKTQYLFAMTVSSFYESKTVLQAQRCLRHPGLRLGVCASSCGTSLRPPWEHHDQRSIQDYRFSHASVSASVSISISFRVDWRRLRRRLLRARKACQSLNAQDEGKMLTVVVFWDLFHGGLMLMAFMFYVACHLTAWLLICLPVIDMVVWFRH